MIRFPLSLLLPAFLLIAPASGLAQGSARTCRIVFLNAPADAPPTMQLFDGVKSLEVELPSMNLSPVYRIAGGAATVALLPTGVEDPASAIEAAPSVRIPEKLKEVFLVVTRDRTNEVAPVKLEVIDGDSAKFKRGQMYWLNLTPYQVGGRLGSRTLKLGPGSRQLVDPPAAGNEDYVVNLEYRRRGDERVFPLTRTKWRHDPMSRSLQFIFSETARSVPRVVGFDDYPAGEAE